MQCPRGAIAASCVWWKWRRANMGGGCYRVGDGTKETKRGSNRLAVRGGIPSHTAGRNTFFPFGRDEEDEQAIVHLLCQEMTPTGKAIKGGDSCPRLRASWFAADYLWITMEPPPMV
jgi:hypothetical protein